MAGTLDETLLHFGVKGMKWGVRRSQKQLARAAEAKTRELMTDEAAKKAQSTYAKIQKHGVASVSTDDLRQLVDRMNLEQNYRRVIDQAEATRQADKNKRSILTKLDKGNKQVKIVMSSAKTMVELNELLKKTTGQSGIDLIRRSASS